MYKNKLYNDANKYKSIFFKLNFTLKKNCIPLIKTKTKQYGQLFSYF